MQTQSYILTDMWILAQKLRIPTIQLEDHMKLNKKEGQSVNALSPLKRGNKIIIEGRGNEGSGWERGEEGKGVVAKRREWTSTPQCFCSFSQQQITAIQGSKWARGLWNRDYQQGCHSLDIGMVQTLWHLIITKTLPKLIQKFQKKN